MKYVVQWVAHLSTIDSIERVALRSLWITLFAVATGLAAWVKVPLPFTPVPITLQTVVVLGAGLALGRDGIYSQVLYLILGGIGMPVFAAGVPNTQALFGPTGGYLIGFVAATAVASLWIRPKWSELSYFERSFRLLLTSLVIFIPGVLQLAWFANLSIEKALTLGFVPFIVGDVLKVLLVSSLSNRYVR